MRIIPIEPWRRRSWFQVIWQFFTGWRASRRELWVVARKEKELFA